MKKIYIVLVLLFTVNTIFAQCNGRYESEIFSDVNITTVNYSNVYLDSRHEMDIYTPDGDTETNRPVVLYMHAGSYSGGSKTLADCIDFCTSMAKRGYVAAALNYRLTSNPINFLVDQTEQYKTVLKTVADAKAAIRYFRKEHAENSNPYNIDPNTIFIGGYSAGAITAIHLAYIDAISDLPTSPINVQNLVTTIGGNLEGDAGNDGYSSQVSAVISFAGGINDENWIDSNDEPLVSIQGTNDQTVNYNCGPGLGNPLVLTLCGSNVMHPKADNVGLLNEKLIFNGTDHQWAAAGNINSKFNDAVNFTANFLYPLLPCSQNTSIEEVSAVKKVVSIVNILGEKSNVTSNQLLLYMYDDGSVQKKIILN